MKMPSNPLMQTQGL